MHGENMRRDELLGKRPRETLVLDDHPSPGVSQTQSNRSTEMEKSAQEMPDSQVAAWELDHPKAGCDDAARSGADIISSVANPEPPHKRRKIHVVHFEIEVKVEEEPLDIWLSDSSLDAQMELDGSSLPSHEFQPSEACESVVPRSTPSAAEFQQPTPPPSPNESDAPGAPLASSSEPPASAAADQHPTPPQTPPCTSTLFTATFPPTPPDSPLPELSLSWPDEVHDFETYELAAASTQKLMEHYMRALELEAGMMSMLPAPVLFG